MQDTDVVSIPTRRKRITTLLERRPETYPTAIQDALSDAGVSVTLSTILDDIESINRSLTDEKAVYVFPPECQDCGFTDWDEYLNIPSKCPNDDCRSEWISEPRLTIRQCTP